MSMQKHIFLPIIAYQQEVNSFYMLSMIELVILLKSNNYNITIEPYFFESLIPRARNAAAAKFLEIETATHMIFIDTDIMFNPNDILKLLEADKQVISGIYPKKYLKDKNADYPVDFTINGSIARSDKEFVYEAEYLPTGFMCINKNCLKKIIIDNPSLRYINNIDGYTTKNNIFYDFFQCTIDNTTKHYLSEDYSFCNLCKKSNIQKYIYSDITLRHIGKHIYEGNIEDFLRKMQGAK